jgi:hypothetical protein
MVLDGVDYDFFKKQNYGKSPRDLMVRYTNPHTSTTTYTSMV